MSRVATIEQASLITFPSYDRSYTRSRRVNNPKKERTPAYQRRSRFLRAECLTRLVFKWAGFGLYHVEFDWLVVKQIWSLRNIQSNDVQSNDGRRTRMKIRTHV